MRKNRDWVVQGAFFDIADQQLVKQEKSRSQWKKFLSRGLKRARGEPSLSVDNVLAENQRLEEEKEQEAVVQQPNEDNFNFNFLPDDFNLEPPPEIQERVEPAEESTQECSIF